MTLQTARTLLDHIVRHASEQGLHLAATVVDASGRTVAFVRMDGVPYVAADVTRRKAVTAAAFQSPSGSLAAMLGGDAVALADFGRNEDLSLLKGGVPVSEDGCVVGGLGVGGASGDQDEAAAQSAVAAVERAREA